MARIEPNPVLAAIARLALAAPRRVVAAAGLMLVATAVFGIPVVKTLSAGGMHDPNSESAQATRLLSEKFGRGDLELLITVTADSGAQAPTARKVGTAIVERLKAAPYVSRVESPWTASATQSPALVSRDGKTGLIVAGITGTETAAQRHAREISHRVAQDRDGVTVRSGGEATIYWQVNAQTQQDLLRMEALAVPLCFLVTVWVFGGLNAAALPMVIGGLAVFGSMAALRAIALVTDVSTFALNLSVAMGLGLGIDYTLLIISRFRDEMAGGASREQALIRTVATAGRTVFFSASTVALSMLTMVLFPQYFLKSFAYAGVAVVAFAATAAIVVTPAAIMLLGGQLDALDLRVLLRRILRRPAAHRIPVEQTFWYRTGAFAMRHAIPVAVAVIVPLLMLGAPFLGVRWGFPDDRVLPRSASAHQVGDQLRHDFAVDSTTNVSVVLPDTAGVSAAELNRYAATLSRVPDVSSVSSPGGTFVAGVPTGPPSAPTAINGGSAFFTVVSGAPLFSDASARQLDRLHAVAAPAGKHVLMTGIAQSNQHDSVHAVTSRLPWVLGAIGVLTLVLLFLLTGSVVLPIKAVLLNILSLTATFGALVWVFQDGHLGALGTSATGALDVNLPVLMFCVAFGLSMDYEVFLISRIREYWHDTADNDRSVALGIAHTGRIITAAALIMAISFAVLMSAQVSFMRLFGLGLTLAVLVDATLVRMLLVPAFMHVLGSLNWWAPERLARLRLVESTP